ncbi:alpha/beta hydrolase [Pseudomonas sp. F1_0610]|uniref:esterase/lipase family protein n=1 Tax=Pseudomonas sp. F1_0610 TaxID=3114284 RepID=UPI0039C304CD
MLLFVGTCLLAGCAGVKVGSVSNKDYISSRRGDVLTTNQLSGATINALRIIDVTTDVCLKNILDCQAKILSSAGLANEQRLSSLSEIWLNLALKNNTNASLSHAAQVDAYIESARFAYAYLFMTQRDTRDRALEDRQTQVRDYYNFASQQASTGLFKYYYKQIDKDFGSRQEFALDSGRWSIIGRLNYSLPEGQELPSELIPAGSLTFQGLRNQYRRDGVGAELVAVTAKKVVSNQNADIPYSETPFPAVTTVLRFTGESLAEVLNTHEVILEVFDPYQTSHIVLAGKSVPLAANFTSGYGLWLARSGFSSQALLTLIGRGEALESPRVYLMQPYDPNRKVLIMLHGLASSPEAWINVANEILGDEQLRQRYQIWQVYYPTNMPIPINNLEVHQAITATFKHFDPQGTAPASQDIVLLGHSMGGILARLLSSSSGDGVWNALLEQYPKRAKKIEKERAKIEPYLYFEPLTGVTRSIFVAAPHQGTPFAENRMARWASNIIKLPVSVMGRLKEIGQILVSPTSTSTEPLNRSFNSIDNLSNQDFFIRVSSQISISPKVTYHSIIGNYTPKVPLEESSDGVVPYQSSHLPGAASEVVIPSWHSVQETPQAIIEIRRILHEHLLQLTPPSNP